MPLLLLAFLHCSCRLGGAMLPLHAQLTGSADGVPAAAAASVGTSAGDPIAAGVAGAGRGSIRHSRRAVQSAATQVYRHGEEGWRCIRIPSTLSLPGLSASSLFPIPVIGFLACDRQRLNCSVRGSMEPCIEQFSR